MSLEAVLGQTKRIEGRLLELGATGRGLHEKATSIEHLLGESTVKRIRFLATVRNRLVHEPDADLTDELMSGFLSTAQTVLGQLGNLLQKRQGPAEDQCSNRSSNAPIDQSFAGAWRWRDTPTAGKVGIVIGVLALGALYVKGEIDDWW